MVSRLSDLDLCQRAWEALRERLGPVDAARFLSLARAPSRDYQAWRETQFQNWDVQKLLDQIESRNQK